MNEEAFNTMYILAQKEGYKKTPEEFKTLLSSNQEALSTMYSIAQREGYKKTPEEFKTLLGVSDVEGEPVNFTEGSGEQQEQPTEPLKKPYSDFSWDDGTSKPALKVTSAKEELDSKLESSKPAEIKTPFQEALNKRINEMGGPVDIPEEEQLESLDIIKKKNKELALSTDPQQKINKDVSGKKIEAQERLDELLLKEFPIEVINPGGRNVSPTIENAEKLTQLDPAFSDFMYSKALNQPDFYDKLKKGQVTDTEKYDILSEYNNIKTQNSYNNLQATINENNKLVKEIDDSIEKQKESMLSTPYFISDLDGKFSIGEINSPEEREEAQAMYDELSSLYEDKKKQSTSPRFSSEYIDFLNASAKQDALETGEYENIHKKIKENQLYAEELMDGSYESFAKDFGARGVNTVSGFIANTMAFPASVASSYRSITGADYKYGVSDMVVDWAERAGSPMVTSERSFAMKDPLTGETRYDAGDFALSVTDQLGLFLGLAVGNKAAASRQLYKLSKIGVTGKRAAEAMKISQRYNTLITGTMASHTHTYREAREMGLSGKDLFVYTTFMSTLEGFSELVFPNQGIFGKDLKDIGLKAFIKNLSKGRSVALKDSFRQILEAMGSEAAEEYLVLLGKMAETSLISLNNDNIETYIPEFEEIISTGAIAATMAGGSTAGIQTYQNITGAKRKEVMSYAISKGTEVDFNGLTEAVGQQVKQGNVSAAEATMYLAQVHEANDFVKYIPDEIKGRTRQELLPIAKEIDGLTKQSKEKEGAAKKAIQERIRVLEGYMESKIQSYPADRGPKKEQSPEATEKTTEQPTYDKPTVFTTPTSERYGTVNRQDGKGGVVLTEEEYNNEVSLFEQQPTETTTEESKDEVSGYVDKLVEDLETETQRLANRTKEQKDLFGDQHTDKKLPYGAAEISDITTTDKNGVTTATYVNPETNSVDAIITATNEDNFVGYIRVYENGKPTDMFTAKMQASESGKFKNIITSAENALPDNAEVVETTTISTGGLKSYNKSRLVEKVDEDGNVVTRPTKYSDATKESVKEKGEAAYNPFKTTDKSAAEAEIAKIKEAYPGINTKIIETKAPPRPPQPGKKPTETVSNQYTISIDLPVLIKSNTTQPTTSTSNQSEINGQAKKPQEGTVRDNTKEATKETKTKSEEASNEVNEAEGRITEDELSEQDTKSEKKAAANKSTEETILEERTDKDFANKNESYRVIVGDEAFNDIVESGTVKVGLNQEAKDNAKKAAETGGINLDRRGTTAFPSFSKGKASMSYAGNNPNHYIVVTEDQSMRPSTMGRHGKGSTMFPTDENGKHLKELDGSKVKVYKHLGKGKYELVYANGKAVESITKTTKKEATTDTQEAVAEGLKAVTELSEEQISELNKFLGLDKSKRKASRKGRTKKDNQRLDKVERAVDLLKQSLSEVMPNIDISVAEDSDIFARIAGEQSDKKEDRSKGLFTRVDGKYVIVLNPDSADVTTLFHEGLHAVLRAAGLPSAQARAVTTRMVEAVKKTATKKLQRELEAFTDLYKTHLKSEEYIAELIGILANNYNEQNNETKSIIRRWLQKLAEMLGLKPKGVSLSTVGLNNTDAATIDALNFVAKKMSEGGVLTEQDLTRLTQPGEEQQGDGSEKTVTRKQKRKKPKNIKGLLDVMEGVFGLNKTQSESVAVVGDVLVETMAKRAGVSKEEMYQIIAYAKAQKAPDGSLKQGSPLFKSTAKEGLSKIQQKAATPEQWVKMITDKGGKGTMQELEWIGLSDFLNDYVKENNVKSVPKEVVEQYINDNQIEIVEVTKGGSTPKLVFDTDVEGRWQAEDPTGTFSGDYTIQWLRNESKFELESADGFISLHDSFEEAADRANKHISSNQVGEVEGQHKYSNYTLEGGENYREVLLVMPPPKIDYEANQRLLDAKSQELFGKPYSELERFEITEVTRKTPLAPLKGENYKSSHWDEANILAHLRLNERTLPNGERVMFIEEVQSDWAQEGKKKGFKGDKSEKQIELERIEKRIPELEKKLDEIYLSNKKENESRSEFRKRNQQFNSLAEKYSSLEPRRRELSNDIERINDSMKTPDMPYKKTDQWVGMAMRRAMQMAAQEGFDRVSWVTGEQSAERYDLSKQIGLASAIKNDDGTYNIVLEDTRGDELTEYRGSGKKMTSSEMEDTIGKELAQKLIEGADRNKGREWKNQPTNPEFFTLRGDGLKVGGEGMKAFYNSILPKVAKKEAQRFDKKANVEVVEIDQTTTDKGKPQNEFTSNAVKDVLEGQKSKQLSIPITPEMRMNLNNAVPLFQGEQGAMLAEDGKYTIYALTNPNVSTPLHELAHVYEHYLTDSERAVIERWSGHKAGTVEFSEKFARGFEKFLAGGKVKNPRLQKIFENFKKWLTEIYNGIKGSEIDIQLNSKMESIYNDMLGAEETPVEAPVKETVTRKQKKKKPKSIVKDAFEWGIQKGVPAIAVKNHLIKLGYTEEEITSGAYDAEKIWNKDGKKVKNWFEIARRSALSARKFRPQSMFLAQEAMESAISAELRQAKMMAEKLNRAINRYKSQDKRDELIDAVDEFMRDAEERDFWRNELPDDIAQIAEAMRIHIDSLSLKLVEVGAIKAESSRENILKNIGVYMNRSFEIFDNKNWKEEVSEQVITAAQNHLREAYYNSLSGIIELDQQLKDGKITESDYNRRKNRILANKASVKKIMDRDNVSEDEALTMHVEKVVDDILTRKDVDEYISFAKSVVGKKDLSSLKRRKDIPPAIRALMGEYTDPGYNYAMSIFKIANLVENQKYLTKIRDAGLGVWLFEDEAGIKKREGYKQITFDGDASMNPLDGLYAPEAVADAFNDIELNRIISGIPVIGTPYKVYLKFVGGVKYSKTILSYGTHAKNVIGNMYFMAQNGYLDPREYQQPFIALVKQFSGKELTAEQEAKMDEWVRAGIIGQGATIGEIKSFFEGEDSFEKALTKRIDKKTDNMLDRVRGSKVGKGVKKFGEKAQEAYQYEDDMFKIVAYEKEKLNYSKILFDGKSYNQLDASQQSTVNEYVAEIIKNILPNYGRIGAFGKFLKAVPIAGTFISFQLEAYRTAYNTVALAMQEIKGDIPGISETGKKLAQKRGVMRLMSIVGFQAFKYGLMSLLGVALIPGDDDDEDGLSEKIRMLLPFWDTNSDIAIQEVKPNGNFTYVSISASDPYGSIFKVVNATKNYTKTGEGFSEIFGELAGPFVSEDILLNTLRNISSNENDYGGKIWRNTDTPFEKYEKIALELYKTFEPGGITSTRKIIKSEDKLNEVLGQFTGFKLHEVKSLEQAGFKFGDIQNKAQESKSAYNSIKYNMDDYETQEDINKVIRASKKAMDKDYQEAVKLYQALISLGVSDADIKKKMYDSGISAPMRSQIARNSVDVKLNPIKK